MTKGILGSLGTCAVLGGAWAAAVTATGVDLREPGVAVVIGSAWAMRRGLAGRGSATLGAVVACAVALATIVGVRALHIEQAEGAVAARLHTHAQAVARAPELLESWHALEAAAQASGTDADIWAAPETIAAATQEAAAATWASLDEQARDALRQRVVRRLAARNEAFVADWGLGRRLAASTGPLDVFFVLLACAVGWALVTHPPRESSEPS